MCSRVEGQRLLATMPAHWRDEPVEIARCGGCGSVVLSAVIPHDAAYGEAHWDWNWYVEQTAGIEVIAATLAMVDAPPGSRMLDVGCGFGFGLDLGEQLFGWTGTGLDPSEAAARGAEELGIDIRPAYLDASFAPGEQYDVILLSEVLEHLPDPHAVLAQIAQRLTPDGIAIITTPDGAVVNRESPSTTVLPALSVGHHEFLASADAFRTMLEHTGLTVDTWVRGPNLCAVASPNPARLARVRRDATVALGDLADYCGRRADRAEPGSALGVGMAARQVKFLAYADRFPDAAAQIPRLRDHILERYGADLDDPTAIAASAEPPSICTTACYFAGVTARYVDQDPDRADALWAAGAATARHHYDVFHRYFDPEVARFEMEALGERALLLAPTTPEAARNVLLELDAAAVRSGDATIATGYRPRVEAALGHEPSLAERARGELGRIVRGIRRRIPGAGTPR